MPSRAALRLALSCLLVAAVGGCGTPPFLEVAAVEDAVPVGGTFELTARAPMWGAQPVHPVTWEAQRGTVVPTGHPLTAVYTAPDTPGTDTVAVTLHAPEPITRA